MIFAHLYNDNSGSPRVLASVIESVLQDDPDSLLFLGSSGGGILGKLPIKTQYFFYPKFSNRVLMFVTYLASQLVLFCKLCFSKEARAQSVVYVNTVLPFGAGFFGFLFRKKVVYHIHEISLSPPLLFKILITMADKLADLQIYVSKIHKELVVSKHPNRVVLANAVSENIYREAQVKRDKNSDDINFVVFMPASLRSYKGIDTFTNLAKASVKEPIRWRLLLNESDQLVENFRQKNRLLENLEILSRVDNPAELYGEADLVINLSYVDQWIETFGLTVAEAFVFGKPVIVPPVGGPAEFVNDGDNGYLIDSHDEKSVLSAIINLKNNKDMYCSFSASAKIIGERFSPQKFTTNLKGLLVKNQILSDN